MEHNSYLSNNDYEETAEIENLQQTSSIPVSQSITLYFSQPQERTGGKKAAMNHTNRCATSFLLEKHEHTSHVHTLP